MFADRSKKKDLVRTYAQLIKNKVPIEHIRERDELMYQNLKACSEIITSYNVFMLAKNHGIRFSPEDITYSDLVAFETIREVLDGK